MSDEFVMLMITCPTADAPRIARALVERRLAACVNMTRAVQSVYRWQGEVEEAEEALLMVKSTSEQIAAIDEALRQLHPYEVFELIAVPIIGGSEAYMRWIRESVGPAR